MPVGRCPLPPQNERHNSLAFKRKPGHRDRSRRTGAPERASSQSRIAVECPSLFYEATDRRSTARQTIREPFGRRSRPNADAIRSADAKCRLRNRLEAQRKKSRSSLRQCRSNRFSIRSAERLRMDHLSSTHASFVRLALPSGRGRNPWFDPRPRERFDVHSCTQRTKPLRKKHSRRRRSAKKTGSRSDGTVDGIRASAPRAASLRLDEAETQFALRAREKSRANGFNRGFQALFAASEESVS